jgi:hypothetical protein
MKWLSCILLSLLVSNVFSQEISGKWYGKLTQGPGGYNNLYDLELNLNQKKNIWGESFASYGNANKVRVGLSGQLAGDRILLSENIELIREDTVPWGWIACIKKFNLTYRKENNLEYLEGTWTGVSKDNPYSRSGNLIEILIGFKYTFNRTQRFSNQHPTNCISNQGAPPGYKFYRKISKYHPKKSN